MSIKTFNDWIVRQIGAMDLQALRSHRPVADSRMVGWLGVGKRPWIAIDRWLEGETAPFNLLISIFALLAVSIWVLGWLPPIPNSADHLFFALMVLFFTRLLLVATRFDVLPLQQMREIQGWLSKFPEISMQASHWMRPGLTLHMGDYRVIRRAVAAYAKKKGLDPEIPAPAIPGWMYRAVEKIRAYSAARASSCLDLAPDKAWEKCVSEGLKWLQNNVSGSQAHPAMHASLSRKDRDTIASLERLRDVRISMATGHLSVISFRGRLPFRSFSVAVFTS